jgi:hypothetical protein
MKDRKNKLLIMDKTKINMKINNIGIDKSLYLYNIKGCFVYIIGKINNIYMEKCDKVNVYFESTVNSFDIYNCGDIYINCSEKLPIFITEKVKSIVTVFKETPFETVFITVSTYNVICYSIKLKRYFPIKFSMFKDRFSTIFQEENPVYKLLPAVDLSNTNSITVL